MIVFAVKFRTENLSFWSFLKRWCDCFWQWQKSSNGKALYGVYEAQNEKSYFIENENELDLGLISPNDKVGICGDWPNVANGEISKTRKKIHLVQRRLYNISDSLFL